MSIYGDGNFIILRKSLYIQPPIFDANNYDMEHISELDTYSPQAFNVLAHVALYVPVFLYLNASPSLSLLHHRFHCCFGVLFSPPVNASPHRVLTDHRLNCSTAPVRCPRSSLPVYRVTCTELSEHNVFWIGKVFISSSPSPHFFISSSPSGFISSSPSNASDFCFHPHRSLISPSIGLHRDRASSPSISCTVAPQCSSPLTAIEIEVDESKDMLAVPYELSPHLDDFVHITTETRHFFVSWTNKRSECTKFEIYQVLKEAVDGDVYEKEEDDEYAFDAEFALCKEKSNERWKIRYSRPSYSSSNLIRLWRFWDRGDLVAITILDLNSND
ncbi:hypothetical protein LXL04_002523 [Taraxacum kok-saghyz]